MTKSKLIPFLIGLLFIVMPVISWAQLSAFQNALEQKKYDSAILYYQNAVLDDSVETKPYFIKYLTALAIKGEYKRVYDTLQPLIISETIPSYLKEKAEALYTICSFAKKAPRSTEITITNLGDSINSSAAEYFPSINFQDSLFIFMRRANWQREDFYTSSLTANGFSKAQLLNDTLNMPNKKGSASLSKDGNTLYYAADYPGMGYGRYDIYKVTKTTTGWSAPKNAGRNINTDFWDSAPSISPDGQSLYFCSNRPDGYGGIDIYVSHKNKQGFWEEAENMGPNINTAADEQTPFIHADNKTLYFASSGWSGYGGSDLFVSRRDHNNNWGTPTNLGYPINTYDNEGSISVASNGTEAYIASDRADSRGGLDIYKVVLANNTRANLIDSPLMKQTLFTITPNQTQVFNNILFGTNSAELTKAGIELEALVIYLQQNNQAQVFIEGHTDNTGSEVANMKLSSLRALAIQNYLTQKGIPIQRIHSKGLGSTQPIAPNTTPEGRALNRRTSFRVQF